MVLPWEMPLTALFAYDEIPELSLTRITPAQIAGMFPHHGQPELPASTEARRSVSGVGSAGSIGEEPIESGFGKSGRLFRRLDRCKV